MPVFHRIRMVMIATATLFAVAVVGIQAVFLWGERAAAIDRAEATTRDLVRVVEQYAKRTFETSDLLTDAVVDRIREAGGTGGLGDGAAVHDFLSRHVQRTTVGDYIMVVGRDAVPIALSHRHPADRVEFSDRAWWKAHAERGLSRFVGQAIHSRITDEVLFTFSRALTDARGAFDGVVQIAIRPQFFEEVPLTSDLGRNAALALIGEEGEVIARTGLDSAGIGQRSVDAPYATADRREGTMHIVSPEDGEPRIVSFRRIEGWPVIATAALPVSAVLESWHERLLWSIAVLALVLAGLGGLTGLGLRLTALEERTRRELQKTNGALAAALADRDLLFKEIHHRVKNNLQVTGSLLFMQAQRFDDPRVRAAFHDTQERLQSISLIHETLYRAETIDRVNLAEYLGRLVDALAATYGAAEQGIDVVLEVEPVDLPLDQAVPLALTLTEVLSNAFKHAFRHGDGGRVIVTARSQAGGLAITVRDTGPGMPAGGPTEGALGMTIIRALTRQIGATIAFENDNGAVFRLVFPTDSLSTSPAPV